MPDSASTQLSKLLIKTTEAGGHEVEAYFNPKELSIDKSVPWQKHKDSKSDSPMVEFTAAEPKSLGVELMFDGFETQTDVYSAYVQPLEKFVMVDSKLKRPPMVDVVWGKALQFKGVIESMGVKYTMFLPDGTPCRCTVNLKMKQADKAAVKSSGGGRRSGSPPPSGTTTQQGQRADQTTAAATGNPNPTSSDVRTTMSNSGQDNPNAVTPGTTVTGGR